MPATITLPYTNPDDSSRFASIHSNPPGIRTGWPAVVYGQYGKGRVIWSAASFEKNEQDAHKQVFLRMIGLLYGGSPPLTTTAPAFVQFTLFRDDGDRSMYLNIVNVQEQTPLIPVGDFPVSLRVDAPAEAVLLLPDGAAVDFAQAGGALSFDVKGIDMFRMYRIVF